MNRLALLEVLDRDGHVRQAVPVTSWPADVGRALDNTLVLDDPHVAAQHLRVDADAEGVFVHVGDTLNGLRAQGRRFTAGERLRVGSQPLRLDIGDTHLRLRLAAHPVAAEQPLRASADLVRSVWPTTLAALLVIAALLFATWLETDPDELTRTLTSTLISMGVAALGWCGLWALISKVFTRRSHFWWHVRVLAIGALAIVAATAGADLLAFSLSWPWASDFAFVLTGAIGAAMLYFHLQGLEPRRRGPMVTVAACAFLGATALTLWSNLQTRDQWGSDLYLTHLFPPSLRLARAVDTATFVQRLAPLQATLDEKAKERDTGDDGTEGEADEE